MMKMLSKTLFLISLILFVIVSCSSQTTDKELIIGTWEGVKRELRDGETGENVTLDGKPYSHDFLIEFKDDGVFYDRINKSTLSYSILQDNFLSIGSSIYIIEKVTSDSLVLLEYTKEDPKNPLVFRTYYKRVRK